MQRNRNAEIPGETQRTFGGMQKFLGECRDFRGQCRNSGGNAEISEDNAEISGGMQKYADARGRGSGFHKKEKEAKRKNGGVRGNRRKGRPMETAQPWKSIKVASGSFLLMISTTA